jgi:hypothetical protein
MKTDTPAAVLCLALLSVGAAMAAGQETTPARPFLAAKTWFQTNTPYDPRVAVATDAVVIHRHGEKGDALRANIHSWQKHGYSVGRMFFADSDATLEYWKGQWDGTPHDDDVEENSAGQKLLCSGFRPYMLPTEGWMRHLEEMAVDSVAAGADAVLPEEPLAHRDTGYEKSFREIWEKRYGTPWMGASSSPGALWLTSQLKTELYIELEQRLADATRRRAQAAGRDVSFLVPVHSLYSNAVSHIVAPLGMSKSIRGADALVGQVWTGPVNWASAHYGAPDKTFFDSAYALYDYFVQLTVGSDRKLFLLVDPVEDDPNHSWPEFEQWYQHCTVAQLLFPEVNSYEVMPWPDRIFLPGHSTGGGTPAPESFRTLVLSIVQVQQEVPAGGIWCASADGQPAEPTRGVGIAVADTLMWEAEAAPALDGVYGLLMPLLKAAVPVSACVAERADEPGYLAQFKVIVLSFEAWKPAGPAFNNALADWVRTGGSLVILGADQGLDGIDPWWAKAGYRTPLQHLLAALKLAAGTAGEHTVEKGHVCIREVSPRAFANPDAAREQYLPLVDRSLRQAGVAGGLKTPDVWCLRRGPFVVAHASRTSLTLSGKFVDLFHAEFPVLDGATLPAGGSGLYRDVTDVLAKNDRPCTLHTTHRLMSEQYADRELRITVRGPAETPAVLRVFRAGRDVEGVAAHDTAGKTLPVDLHEDGPTLLARFPNAPAGATLTIRFKLEQRPRATSRSAS